MKNTDLIECRNVQRKGAAREDEKNKNKIKSWISENWRSEKKDEKAGKATSKINETKDYLQFGNRRTD